MNTIYWHMNATLGGANLHSGVNLLPGANLHPGAKCAHEHGLRWTGYPEVVFKDFLLYTDMAVILVLLPASCY